MMFGKIVVNCDSSISEELMSKLIYDFNLVYRLKSKFISVNKVKQVESMLRW